MAYKTLDQNIESVGVGRNRVVVSLQDSQHFLPAVESVSECRLRRLGIRSRRDFERFLSEKGRPVRIQRSRDRSTQYTR